jgi:hypothetical protein
MQIQYSSLYRTELLSLIYDKYGQLALRLTPSYKNGTFLSSSHAKVLAIKLSIIAAEKKRVYIAKGKQVELGVHQLIYINNIICQFARFGSHWH